MREQQRRWRCLKQIARHPAEQSFAQARPTERAHDNQPRRDGFGEGFKRS